MQGSDTVCILLRLFDQEKRKSLGALLKLVLNDE